MSETTDWIQAVTGVIGTSATLCLTYILVQNDVARAKRERKEDLVLAEQRKAADQKELQGLISEQFYRQVLQTFIQGTQANLPDMMIEARLKSPQYAYAIMNGLQRGLQKHLSAWDAETEVAEIMRVLDEREPDVWPLAHERKLSRRDLNAIP